MLLEDQVSILLDYGTEENADPIGSCQNRFLRRKIEHVDIVEAHGPHAGELLCRIYSGTLVHQEIETRAALAEQGTATPLTRRQCPFQPGLP